MIMAFNTNAKKGCFYGLAIGDALGAAVEFRDPGTFEPVTGYRGGGPHGIEAGEWTDDTSMALALADSLSQEGWSEEDQLKRYVSWWQEGKYSVNNWCFDIGGTTRDALESFMLEGTLTGPEFEGASGNGSIMRLAPVAIQLGGVSSRLSVYLAASSSVTHASPLCTASCVFLGHFLTRLMEGDLKHIALDRAREQVRDSPRVEAVTRSWETNPDIRGTGFVLQSLEAALWAFMTSNTFEETVLKAVNLGDDADTTGAVAGQMAGAYYGYKNIPQHLIDGLAKKEMIDLYLNPILGE